MVIHKCGHSSDGTTGSKREVCENCYLLGIRDSGHPNLEDAKFNLNDGCKQLSGSPGKQSWGESERRKQFRTVDSCTDIPNYEALVEKLKKKKPAKFWIDNRDKTLREILLVMK